MDCRSEETAESNIEISFIREIMTKIKNTSATNPRQKTENIATKKKKSNVSVTDSPQIRNTSATHLQQICYKSVPLLAKFRGYLKRSVANQPQVWMPIETNLITRYEFATLSPQTRYIFVAILLYCGMRGVDEIPVDITFLSNTLAVNSRMLKKSLKELEISGLLLEREKERENREEKTDRQTGENSRVSVSDFNSFEEEEKEFSNGRIPDSPSSEVKTNGNLSDFSLVDCLRYVELCQSKGDQIANPRALATNLFRSGESDAFILGMLYPEKVKVLDRQTFGNPIVFTDSPCSVCFGGKMSDLDGKGYSACKHCRNERGNATGYEPKEQANK